MKQASSARARAAYERRCAADQIALDATLQIVGIFEAKHVGGTAQRNARIQVAILDAIEAAGRKA